VTVSLTNANPIPSDGKILVTFGSNFDLTGVNANDPNAPKFTLPNGANLAKPGRNLRVIIAKGVNESGHLYFGLNVKELDIEGEEIKSPQDVPEYGSYTIAWDKWRGWVVYATYPDGAKQIWKLDYQGISASGNYPAEKALNIDDTGIRILGEVSPDVIGGGEGGEGKPLGIEITAVTDQGDADLDPADTAVKYFHDGELLAYIDLMPKSIDEIIERDRNPDPKSQDKINDAYKLINDILTGTEKGYRYEYKFDKKHNKHLVSIHKTFAGKSGKDKYEKKLSSMKKRYFDDTERLQNQIKKLQQKMAK